MAFQHFDDEYFLIISNRRMMFFPSGNEPAISDTLARAVAIAAERGFTLRVFPPDHEAFEMPTEQVERLAEILRRPVGPGLGIAHTRYWMAA